jgi:hypothetical protein
MAMAAAYRFAVGDLATRDSVPPPSERMMIDVPLLVEGVVLGSSAISSARAASAFSAWATWLPPALWPFLSLREFAGILRDLQRIHGAAQPAELATEAAQRYLTLRVMRRLLHRRGLAVFLLPLEEGGAAWILRFCVPLERLRPLPVAAAEAPAEAETTEAAPAE